MRGRRIFLPGWWKLSGAGIEWSQTARDRIGLPDPGTGPRDDWALWTSELQNQDQRGDRGQVPASLPVQQSKGGDQG